MGSRVVKATRRALVDRRRSGSGKPPSLTRARRKRLWCFADVRLSWSEAERDRERQRLDRSALARPNKPLQGSAADAVLVLFDREEEDASDPSKLEGRRQASPTQGRIAARWSGASFEQPRGGIAPENAWTGSLRREPRAWESNGTRVLVS